MIRVHVWFTDSLVLALLSHGSRERELSFHKGSPLNILTRGPGFGSPPNTITRGPGFGSPPDIITEELGFGSPPDITLGSGFGSLLNIITRRVRVSLYLCVAPKYYRSGFVLIFPNVL